MKIRHLLCVASLASVFACGGDDTEDDTAADSSSGTPTTDPTMTTDPTATTDDTSGTATDPTTGTATDPTTGTDPTLDSSGTDSGTGDTGGSMACQAYCALFQDNCDGGVGGSMPYQNENMCLEACAEFSVEGLECRTGHLDGTATGVPDPDEKYYETHCPHGDATGGGVCMD